MILILQKMIKVTFKEYYYLALICNGSKLTFEEYEYHKSNYSREIHHFQVKRPNSLEWICYSKQCKNILKKKSDPEHCIGCSDDPHHYSRKFKGLYWCLICKKHETKDHMHKNELFEIPLNIHCNLRACILNNDSEKNHDTCKEKMTYCQECKQYFEEDLHCQKCVDDPHHLQPMKSKNIWCQNCFSCHLKIFNYCLECKKCFSPYYKHCQGLRCKENPHHDYKYPTCHYCHDDPHHENESKKNHKYCEKCQTCHHNDAIFYCSTCNQCYYDFINHCSVCEKDPHHIKKCEKLRFCCSPNHQINCKANSKYCEKCHQCHLMERIVVGSFKNRFGSYQNIWDTVTQYCDKCKLCHNKNHSC